MARRGLFGTAALFGLLCNSCGTTPSEPPPAELDRGLIIFYAGASSVPEEEILWFIALRAAGIDQAIQGIAWGIPYDNYNNAILTDRARAFAVTEAARLAQYMDDYPGRPVTLMGYSAGALVAAFVAEQMPADHPIDRFVMVSPDASPDYDLTAALDHTRLGGVSFWSPIDDQISALTVGLGTLDGFVGIPAATAGFRVTDPRLTQISWSPEMLLYGHLGKHFDYVLNPVWFAHFVSPWVPPSAVP